MSIDEVKRRRLSELQTFIEENFDELCDYVRYKMHALSGTYLKKDEVKEVMNDTYLTAYSSLLVKDRSIQHYEGWVRKLIYFSLLSRLKRDRRFKGLHQTIDNIEYTDRLSEFLHYSIEKKQDQKDELERIKSLLSEEEWQNVEMHLDGYKAAEIADKLKKSNDAVRKQYSRSLVKIRKKYRL